MDQLISLRSLVPDLNPAEYKLHCAVWNQKEQPLDVFARSREEWMGWNTWRGAKNMFNRQFIFSMMQAYEEPGCWIFGGVFEVLERGDTPKSHAYKVKLRDDILGAHIGRLKLRFHPRGRTMRLNFENCLDEIEVAEILPVPYAGPPFPGHDKINLSFRQLSVVVRQDRSDWKHSLEHMKGVYVLHDRTTGMPYVGSASGDTGIWARWCQYAHSLHGNNVDLRDLVQREGEEYVRDNFNFALLEFWSMKTSDSYVLERESYWKEVLMSRTFGHNLN